VVRPGDHSESPRQEQLSDTTRGLHFRGRFFEWW
jgi:hypothetical protein